MNNLEFIIVQIEHIIVIVALLLIGLSLISIKHTVNFLLENYLKDHTTMLKEVTKQVDNRIELLRVAQADGLHERQDASTSRSATSESLNRIETEQSHVRDRLDASEHRADMVSGKPHSEAGDAADAASRSGKLPSAQQLTLHTPDEPSVLHGEGDVV